MSETVIVGGARTAFGKLGGLWKDVPAVELGAASIRGAIARSGLEASRIDAVLMGMVLQAGMGQNPARQAARLAGLDWTVTADTVNKVCASGMRAVSLGAQLIRAGEAGVVVAGGMESMSNTPYAVPSARWGLRSGHGQVQDLNLQDGLRCPFESVHMAVYGSRAAEEFAISREEQDGWALRSHQRAVAAVQQGRFAEEIVPVRNAAPEQDEAPRQDTDTAKLGKLAPLFDARGTVTAGNAPGLNDGAAALILMSKVRAEHDGYEPLATIVAHASVGVEPAGIAAAPAFAIRKLLQKTGLVLEDIDLFELNEAFAAVVLTCGHLLGWDPERVNVHGGAIALGHPIGASGARIVLTLVQELRRRGGGMGIAAICSGGAQGDALLIRVDK